MLYCNKWREGEFFTSYHHYYYYYNDILENCNGYMKRYGCGENAAVKG
jgi:hypothetical protein